MKIVAILTIVVMLVTMIGCRSTTEPHGQQEEHRDQVTVDEIKHLLARWRVAWNTCDRATTRVLYVLETPEHNPSNIVRFVKNRPPFSREGRNKKIAAVYLNSANLSEYFNQICGRNMPDIQYNNANIDFGISNVFIRITMDIYSENQHYGRKRLLLRSQDDTWLIDQEAWLPTRQINYIEVNDPRVLNDPRFRLDAPWHFHL